MGIKRWLLTGAATTAAAVTLIVWIARSDNSVSADQTPDQSPTSFLSRLMGSRVEMLSLPAGTLLRVRLEQGISTAKNATGDPFSASLDEPLAMDSRMLAPKGSQIYGLLTDVTDAGKMQGRASLTMVLRQIQVGNKKYDLVTQPLTLEGPSPKKRAAKIIGGAGATGAVAGVAAGGGTGYVPASQGDPVAYGPEARFTFSLADVADLPVYQQ